MAKKPKKVAIRVMDRYSHETMYAMLDEVVQKWHGHLTDASIVLAWNTSWSADADGRLVLGKCKKASDLDRELFASTADEGEQRQLDFVILLNEEAWHEMGPAQQTALLDHEVSHCAIAEDENGHPKHDECGRVCYRIKKHDLEEFRDVVSRHGAYKSDIEAFVRAAVEGKKAPLLKVAEG